VMRYSAFTFDQRGAVSIELTAILPIFVVIIVGVADISNFVLKQAELDRRMRDAIQTHYGGGPRDPALTVIPGCSCATLGLSATSGCTDKPSTTHTLLKVEETVTLNTMPAKVAKSAVCVLNL
jgi:hypothetical protein